MSATAHDPRGPAAGADGTPAAGRRASRSTLLALLALMLLAAVLRAVHLVQIWNEPSFLTPLIDAASYWRWGHRIAAGEIVGRAAFFQEPLYPYLLGGLFALTRAVGEDSIRLVAVVQSVLGVLSVPLVWVVARRLFESRRAPLICAALYATYQPFLVFEGLLEKENVALPLGLLLLLALLRARERRTAAFLLPGVLMGWLALVRGNDLLLAPLVALAVVHDARRIGLGGRAACARAATFLLGAALGLAPATLHNALATGHFVLSTSQAGSAFYNCNCKANANGLGVSAAAPLIRQVPETEPADYQHEAERRLGVPYGTLAPGDVSRFWFRQTLREIAEDPSRFIRAERNKLLMLFNAYESPDNYSIDFESRFAGILRADPVRFALVGPLAVAGAWWLLRSRRRAPFLFVLAFGYLATLPLFIVTARYRLPALPFLLLLAGSALAHVLDVLSSRSGRAALGLLPPLAAGVLLAWPPFDPATEAVRAKDLAVRFRNHANTLSDRGDQRGALAMIEQALALTPGSGPIRASHAQILASQGSAEASAAAAAELDALIAEDPRNVNALRLRGALAIATGDDALALERLGRARDIRPWDADILGYRAQALYNLRQVDEAVAELRSALALDPTLIANDFTLALMLSREGRVDEARAPAREFVRRGGRVPAEHAARFEPLLREP